MSKFCSSLLKIMPAGQVTGELATSSGSVFKGIFTLDIQPAHANLTACIASSGDALCSIYEKSFDDQSITDHMEDDLGIEDSLEVYARYFIDAIQRGLSIPAQWVGGANDLPSSSSLPVVAAVHIYYEIGDTKMSTAIQLTLKECCKTDKPYKMMNLLLSTHKHTELCNRKRTLEHIKEGGGVEFDNNYTSDCKDVPAAASEATSRSEPSAGAHQLVLKQEEGTAAAAAVAASGQTTSAGEEKVAVGAAAPLKRRKPNAGRGGGVNLFPGRKVGK